MEIEKKIIGYCDGACKGNPGIGGWGSFYTVQASPTTNLRYTNCGGKLVTTNSEMEIRAFKELLDLIPLGRKITIYSDSTYVIKTLVKESGCSLEPDVFTGWIGKWMTSGWKTSKGEVAHINLWKSIVKKIGKHLQAGSTIEIRWVKGHSNDEGNDFADHLANLGVEKVRS